MNLMEEMHFTVTYIMQLFWIFLKHRQKLKKLCPICLNKAQAVMLVSNKRPLYTFKTIERNRQEKMHFAVTLHYIFFFQKFDKKNSKLVKIVKSIVTKAQAVILISIEEPCLISKRLNKSHKRKCILHLLYVMYHFENFKIRQK